MRLDLQSAVILLAALTSSFAAAFALGNLSDGSLAEAHSVLVTIAAEPSAPASGRATQIVRSADGHYWAQADVDGRAVKVLVDTGASVVALTREDAARLGLRLQPDDFTREVQTASGTARAAPVMLERVAVAGAAVENVQALVVEAGLSHSLLGMSYLGRLSRFEATPSGLTLRP